MIDLKDDYKNLHSKQWTYIINKTATGTHSEVKNVFKFVLMKNAYI